MEHIYLPGQGLSGHVQSEASWKMKDAKALHIIQLSCGRQILDEISHSKTAKEAWIFLRDKYGKDLGADRDPRGMYLNAILIPTL